MKRRWLGGAAIVVAWMLVHGADPVLSRAQAFARLPDWRGIWIPDDDIMVYLGLTNAKEVEGGRSFSDTIASKHLPYKPEWEARYQARNAGFAVALAGRGEQLKECGFYFPGIMESPWPFEALITPEQIALIFGGREVRHIYTDGRKHLPDDESWATPWGDSTGHWEGQTLVVETVAVASEGGPGTMLLSERARFIERIRRVSPTRIEDELTIEDPDALTGPYRITLAYMPMKGLDRLIHGDCAENDRDQVVAGKPVVVPAAR